MKTVRVNYAALFSDVEKRMRSRRVPGRALAILPLKEWRRLRLLEKRVAEDEADARAFLARERESGEWRPWRELRQRVDP